MNQPNPVAAPSSAKWWVLATLSLLTFGNYYAYDAVAPLAGHLSSELGTAYGLMFMVQAIGVAAANMIAGMLNDWAGAGSENPGGYTPMLIFFAALASSAFVFAIALWRREIGPHGHGLEIPR